MLDALLASEELPEEYRDRCQVRHSFDIFFKRFFKQITWDYSYEVIITLLFSSVILSS